MRRVSYQSVLGAPTGAAASVYVRLGESAIATRAKDARTEVRVHLSKAQARWLDEVVALTGPDIDRDAVVRSLVDLGTELEIDWAVIARGKALRAAVREAVMVRRRASG